jgi:hypothetical protein
MERHESSLIRRQNESKGAGAYHDAPISTNFENCETQPPTRDSGISVAKITAVASTHALRPASTDGPDGFDWSDVATDEETIDVDGANTFVDVANDLRFSQGEKRSLDVTICVVSTFSLR